MLAKVFAEEHTVSKKRWSWKNKVCWRKFKQVITDRRSVSLEGSTKNVSFCIKYRTQSGYRLCTCSFFYFYNIHNCSFIVAGWDSYAHSLWSLFVVGAYTHIQIRNINSNFPHKNEIQLPKKIQNPLDFTVSFVLSHLQLNHGEKIKS